MLLAYSWPTPSILLAYSWHTPGILLAYSWHAPDILLAYSWPAVSSIFSSLQIEKKILVIINGIF
jgi:hypothetical protein